MFVEETHILLAAVFGLYLPHPSCESTDFHILIVNNVDTDCNCRKNLFYLTQANNLSLRLYGAVSEKVQTKTTRQDFSEQIDVKHFAT